MFVSKFLVVFPRIEITVYQAGPMDVLLQTLRKEGFFALYKGTYYLTFGAQMPLNL